MKILDTSRVAPWLIAGVALMALLLGVIWRFGQPSNPAAALARKASRVDLVGRMQLALASASEAEKSAVLALTDEASLAFADQARAAAGRVEQGRGELERALAAEGTARERELLVQFTSASAALRRVDDEVLDLAVKNTNLKAQAMTFGPAAAALGELDQALVRLEADRRDPAEEARVRRLVERARVGALRIQALLPTHVWEESEAVEDRLEATMAAEAKATRSALDGLVALSRPGELAQASAILDRYLALQRQVVALSRENTNLKSLALSLGQKRTAQALCQDTLAALQLAILEEPIAGVTYGRPVSPR